MMDCDETQRHLNDLLDGTLNALQAEDVSAHLANCGACRRELHALRATVEMVRSVAAPDSGRSRRRVMSRFAAAAHDERKLDRRPWRATPAVASLAMAAAALCIFALRPHLATVSAGALPPGLRLPVATVTMNEPLPTTDELDQMTSLHAVESIAQADGDEAMQQDALADAASRLESDRRGR